MSSLSLLGLSIVLNCFASVGLTDSTNHFAIANAATLQPGIAPGSLAMITGRDLAAGEALGGYGEPPLHLGGISVEIGGRSAGLLYVSSERILFRVPLGLLTGRVRVVVNNAEGAKLVGVADVERVAPGIFVAGENTAVLENEAGSMNSVETPALAGSYVAAQVTGVDSNVSNTFIKIGTELVQVSSAYPAPGMPGVVLLRFKLPRSSAGSHPMQVIVGGTASNIATVWIR
jgi:uncharacterized protein (TIGR03437 family)